MRQTIYAAIGINDDEGIIAVGINVDHQIPLMCTEDSNLEAVKKMAYRVHKDTGKTVVVARFDMTEVLERYDGTIFARPPAGME